LSLSFFQAISYGLSRTLELLHNAVSRFLVVFSHNKYVGREFPELVGLTLMLCRLGLSPLIIGHHFEFNSMIEAEKERARQVLSESQTIKKSLID
jgi:hypothetical protein